MTTEAPAKTENIEIFYTGKDYRGTKVSLWITHKTKDGSPDIDGKVGDLRVAAYIRNGSRGPFLSFIDSTKPKDANGHYTQFGMGNIVIVAGGRAKLTIKKPDGEVVWAEVSRKAPQELLVAMGLDLERQAQKTAAGGGADGEQSAPKAAASAPSPAPAKQPVSSGFDDMQDDDIPF